MKFAQINDLMYYVRRKLQSRRYIMNTFVALFRNIFSFGNEDEVKVGLSQFNRMETKKIEEQKSLTKPGEIRLSDLMKRNY